MFGGGEDVGDMALPVEAPSGGGSFDSAPSADGAEAAAATAAVPAAGAADSRGGVGGWLRAEDAAYYEEDEERNEVQAKRNERMRALLRKRRRQREDDNVETVELESRRAMEDFMSVGEFGRKGAINEHLPPWFVQRPHIESVALRLHEELLDFAQFMKPLQEEVDARRQWVRVISGYCKTLWPACSIRVFGSFFTGLSLPNGDVDVAIMNVPCKSHTAMKILADTMLAGNEISWLEIIESAKVPVMKIRSQAVGLRADIVVNQQDGLDTSKFIKQSIKAFPQMRPLLIFVKYYLLQRGLNDTFTGGMGSYLLCNVVLHFLQRHPSVRNPQLHASTSLGHLLFDFLKYYGQDFKYDVGISVREGGYTFRKEERFASKGKGKAQGKGVSLCMESPIGASPFDLGAPAFRFYVMKNLFHHGFHCVSNLFVTRAPPEESLLCPFLLDPRHGVITERFSLMSEQPAALASMRLQGTAAADEVDAPDGVGDNDEPSAKRPRPATE